MILENLGNSRVRANASVTSGTDCFSDDELDWGMASPATDAANFQLQPGCVSAAQSGYRNKKTREFTRAPSGTTSRECLPRPACIADFRRFHVEDGKTFAVL